MTNDTRLPEWPELPATDDDVLVWTVYERDRADAWEARARVAVEALQDIKNRYYIDSDIGLRVKMPTPAWLSGRAINALDEIGPLPESKE